MDLSRQRRGVGNVVLVALVLALALAAVLGYLAVSAQGDVLDVMDASQNETDDRFDEQKDSLLEKIQQAIEDAVGPGSTSSSENGGSAESQSSAVQTADDNSSSESNNTNQSLSK